MTSQAKGRGNVSKPEATPGPWRAILGHNNHHDHAITSDAAGHADSRIGWVRNWPLDVSDANAHLIAAAPDLLAELEADLQTLIDLQDKHLSHRATVVRALVQKRIDATSAAIAKARGQ